jgi:hypothetical protein
MEILEQEGNAILARLNFIEIVALSNALNESLEHLEEWEFETRMGVSCDQVRVLLATFNKIQTP